MSISDGLNETGLKKRVLYGNTIWATIYDKEPDMPIIGDFKSTEEGTFLYLSNGWIEADDLIDFIDIL